MRRGAWTHGHCTDLRAARRAAPAEIPLRRGLHSSAVVLARRAADSAVVLDHISWHLGGAREEVLAIECPRCRTWSSSVEGLRAFAPAPSSRPRDSPSPFSKNIPPPVNL